MLIHSNHLDRYALKRKREHVVLQTTVKEVRITDGTLRKYIKIRVPNRPSGLLTLQSWDDEIINKLKDVKKGTTLVVTGRPWIHMWDHYRERDEMLTILTIESISEAP